MGLISRVSSRTYSFRCCSLMILGLIITAISRPFHWVSTRFKPPRRGVNVERDLQALTIHNDRPVWEENRSASGRWTQFKLLSFGESGDERCGLLVQEAFAPMTCEVNRDGRFLVLTGDFPGHGGDEKRVAKTGRRDEPDLRFNKIFRAY